MHGLPPQHEAPATALPVGSPRPSIWAGARHLLQELDGRRLRLSDLPPLPRLMARVALVLIAITAVLLAAYPLIETGSGYFPFTSSNLERVELSVVAVIVVFGGAAVAFALAAYAAPARLRRPVNAGLAVASFAMLPSDLNGRVQSDQLGLNIEWPLATWAMFLGLTAAIALVSAAVIGLPRSRHTLAVLAATPPVCGLVILATLARQQLPPELVGGDAYALGRLATSVAAKRGLVLAECPTSLVMATAGLTSPESHALDLECG